MKGYLEGKQSWKAYITRYQNLFNALQLRKCSTGLMTDKQTNKQNRKSKNRPTNIQSPEVYQRCECGALRERIEFSKNDIE